jgi:hypothetical protein
MTAPDHLVLRGSFRVWPTERFSSVPPVTKNQLQAESDSLHQRPLGDHRRGPLRVQRRDVATWP